MGELKNREKVLTNEQSELVKKINVLSSIHRKGKLGKTGHENIKRYRDKLDSTGYNWMQEELLPTSYLMYVVKKGKRVWVKN